MAELWVAAAPRFCKVLESFTIGLPCFLSTYPPAITFCQEFVTLMLARLPTSLRTLGFLFAAKTYDGDGVTREDVLASLENFPWNELELAVRRSTGIRRLVFELRWEGPYDGVTWEDEHVEFVFSKLDGLTGESIARLLLGVRLTGVGLGIDFVFDSPHTVDPFAGVVLHERRKCLG